MKSGSETTYILLTKDVEDKLLYAEISSIQKDHPGRSFYENYPMLGELRHKLARELEEE